MTGGAYLPGYTYVPMHDHCAFACMMNADGSWPLQQTNYVCPGDADNNDFHYLVDDALETMLALGQSGPARDTSTDGWVLNSWCEFNDIAIDWPTSNAANHKYSDFDGNGFIDTNDVNRYINCTHDSVPLYYRFSQQVETQIAEDFCLIPLEDTVAFGDTSRFYMVLGSDSNPVDSIYGFAFAYYFLPPSFPYIPYPSLDSTTLGIPGTDLFLLHDNLTGTLGERLTTLICRTDFQNAYGVNDTLGIISGVIYAYNQPIEPYVADFKAILADGTEIPFNICTGSVFIDTTFLASDNNELKSIEIYPNPASDFLTIKHESKSALKIVIINSLGQSLKQVEASAEKTSIDVSDLANGVYAAILFSNDMVIRNTIIIQH